MRYYVNDRAQDNGDHEVHTETCASLPAAQNRTYLGNFDSCRQAVAAARRLYARADGCFHCSRPCHSG